MFFVATLPLKKRKAFCLPTLQSIMDYRLAMILTVPLVVSVFSLAAILTCW